NCRRGTVRICDHIGESRLFNCFVHDHHVGAFEASVGIVVAKGRMEAPRCARRNVSCQGVGMTPKTSRTPQSRIDLIGRGAWRSLLYATPKRLGLSVVYGPKLLGRSRHGAPDRKTQKMPLRTLRSSTRGTPRGLFGSNGLMANHSQSVSS